MKILVPFISLLFLAACNQSPDTRPRIPDQKLTYVSIDTAAFQQYEEVYVPVYSDIYNFDESTKYLLTVTLSMRNTSTTDSLFISKVDYFDSKGEKLRSYLKQPIGLKPLESVEFVVENHEKQGGTGANFLVDWGTTKPTTAPVIQAVMIGTTSQQGISFVTDGVTLFSKKKAPTKP